MRTRVGTTATMAALALAVLLVAASCSIPLGDLGGPTSIAYAINDAGVIVGGSEVPGSTPANLIERAFRRLPNGTVVELASPPGTQSAAAVAINDAGEAAGWVVDAGAAPSSALHLVRWDPSGTVHDLGLLGSANASVRAIDTQGRIIGYHDRMPGTNTAFVYDPELGELRDLPDVPDGGNSIALGMNDEGDVVGYQWIGANTMVVPVRWDLDAWTATDLSSTWGRAVLIDINDAGTVIGQARFEGTTPWNGVVEAAILRPGETAPTPLGAGAWSFAVSVNDDDVVVGWGPGGPDPNRAYRWDSTSGVVPLTEGGNSFALDINDHGQMVGADTQRAVLFVATP